MEFHGIEMMGDFETDNIKAKDSDGIKLYDDSGIITFKIEDGGYIAAYQGASINEFSTDGTFTGNSDLAVPTEKAVKTYIDSVVASYQPLDSDLTTIASLTPSDSNFIVGDGSDWVTESGATARTSLGLGSAAIRDAEDTLTNGANLPDGAAIIAYCDSRYLNEASNLSDLNNASTARSNLGVTIGSDVQAWDSQLDEIAALLYTDGNFIVGNGSGWVAENGATARESLGLTGNNNTTHYHDHRYYTETEFSDGSTITAIINRIKLNGTTKADGYFYAGDTDPTNSTRLNYDGYLYATRVYNPVYSDVADFQDLNDELIYGKCYYDTVDGVKICSERCKKGIIGISTDTFGLSCGFNRGKEQVPIAIAGWILAHVDKEYEIGTPLTNDSNGDLTEMMPEEIKAYPERIVATYKKKEQGLFWNNIVVNDRHWVKVK